MRSALVLPLLALLTLAEEPLPADVAAAHPEGKWQVRFADLYTYVVKYWGGTSDAKPVLPDYMKQRLVQAEARARGIVVTDAELDKWLEALDQRIRRESGGTLTLEDYRKEEETSAEALRRRAMTAVLRERLARAIYLEKDPGRRKDEEVPEDSVDVVIDELYRKTAKETDRSKLPAGVVARVGATDVTEYEYGRELVHMLPPRAVVDALNQRILVEEARLLPGGDQPPSPQEWEEQKRRFMAYQRNLLSAKVKDASILDDQTIAQVVEQQRGLTLDEVFKNPAFLAETKARGHFRGLITDADIDKFHAENRNRYSDRLRVARIFIEARAQRQVQGAGKPIRTLDQGKALAEALWVRATQGVDFGKLAKENSDDATVVRERGGEIPALLVAGSPNYEDTWAQANELQVGEISKPFYSRFGGYVIVKLLERQSAAALAETRDRCRDDIAHQRYILWRDLAMKNARRSKRITEGR
jgi:hypothetical protein